jgi:hypothetical protein
VSDVVHLLAEIIENATIFSSKDTPVHISGHEIPSGGVLIEVSDSGVGVPEARLTEMNLRLDNPPVIDVSVSRHMGLFAVARLAERHGVRVRLRARSPRGLIALVWLPDSVTELGTAPARWPRGRLGVAAGHGSGGSGTGAHAAPDGQSSGSLSAGGQSSGGQSSGGLSVSGWQTAIAVPPAGTTPMPTGPTGPAMPARAAGTAGPTQASVTPREPVQAADSAVSDWFRSPRSPVAGNGGSPTTAQPTNLGWRADADGWAEGRHAAQIVADPVRGDQTAAGLPVRVPRANLISGSAGSHRAGSGATSRRPDGRPGDGRPSDSRGAQAAPAARAPRSPELARNRLSGFQRGTRRAKGQTPHAGEGADR